MTRRAAACAASQTCLVWSTSAAGVVLFAAAVWAQTPVVRPRIERYVVANQRQIVAELADLLSIPNIASDAENMRIAKVVMCGATNAYRTSPLLPESKHVVDAVTKMWEAQPVQLRTSGGTAPIAPFIEAMGSRQSACRS